MKILLCSKNRAESLLDSNAGWESIHVHSTVSYRMVMSKEYRCWTRLWHRYESLSRLFTVTHANLGKLTTKTTIWFGMLWVNANKETQNDVLHLEPGVFSKVWFYFSNAIVWKFSPNSRVWNGGFESLEYKTGGGWLWLFFNVLTER